MSTCAGAQRSGILEYSNGLGMPKARGEIRSIHSGIAWADVGGERASSARSHASLATHARARASWRPWMFIGRSRVRRRGASALLCIDLKTLPECAAARRLIRCRATRPWLRGSQCTRVCIRWHQTDSLEQEPMANTPWARRMRGESGSACPHTVIKHAQTRAHADFAAAVDMGRRTTRSGTLQRHSLQQMGHEAC